LNILDILLNGRGNVRILYRKAPGDEGTIDLLKIYMRRDLVPTVTSLKGSLPKLPELG